MSPDQYLHAFLTGPCLQHQVHLSVGYFRYARCECASMTLNGSQDCDSFVFACQLAHDDVVSQFQP